MRLCVQFHGRLDPIFFFCKRSRPRYRTTTFIQLGSGAVVSVQQAYEIVAKLRELEKEQNIMKCWFNRAVRTGQSCSDVKLNFRQTERHMPGMFNGQATEKTEYKAKVDDYLSTLDPGGKGGEILRAAATEAKDMDDDEVANLAICWNVFALNSALASCLITTFTGEVGVCSSSAASILRICPQSVAGAEQMIPTKISCSGSSFHGRHHRAIESKVDW